jgi:peptidoglycan/xylan/chitin deacetylase (PgdA/CDA1 family)
MKLALRIDDIGASTKRYEIYSNHLGGNILFLKYLPWFRAWGPYREMTANELEQLFDILQKFNAKLTVAITATWVEKDGSLVPYSEKFPHQAAALKKAVQQGLLEIANHGLTHCVLNRHLFKPRLFGSNRKYHREFWEWLPEDVHRSHIQQSQKILQDYFQVTVTTFVPPGNVYADATVQAAKQFGINLINCHTGNDTKNGIRILGDEQVLAFHDRELVLEGVNWLENKLVQQPDVTYCFVKDL